MPGRSLTLDEKRIARRMKDEGGTNIEIARKLGRHETTIGDLFKGKLKGGAPGPSPRNGREFLAQEQERGVRGPRMVGELSLPARRSLDDIELFAERYFGYITMPYQSEAAVRIVDLQASEAEEYVVLNQPPGSGKSTFWTLVLPAWVTCRDRTIRGFIGSASATTAAWYTGRLRTAFTRRVPVKAKPQDLRLGIAHDAEATLVGDFGRFRPEQGEDVWQAAAFSVAQFDEVELSEKERTWSAFGRNATFLGSRVDLVIWDDAYDPTRVRTLEAREELFNWWDDIAETRLEPGGLMILQGQRLGPDDLYRYALDKRAPAEGEDEDAEDSEMTGRKYHHIVFPAHFEDRCQGALTHRKDAPPYPEGCLLYPRRLPWSKLRVIRENSPAKYEVIYQQNDASENEVLVRPIWVAGGDDDEGVYPGCWDNDRGCWELPKGLAGERMVVLTVDPSPTMYWALQVWCLVRDAVSGSELRFLLDLDGRRMTSDDFLDWNAQAGRFTGVAEEWMQMSVEKGLKIGTVIVEVNAAARFMLQSDAVRRWQQRWGVNLLPHTTSRNKSDPDLGVPIIGPRWKYGQVRLPGKRADRFKSVKLVDEVTRWRAGVKQRDDQVMAEWFFEHNLAKLAPLHSEPVKMWVPSWAADA